MFTNNKAKYFGDNKVLIDAACLKTDTKPTQGIANGSKCIEMDTGKTYMFNEEDSEWEELPSSGGGGGGSSDFSTATVSIVNTNGSANIDFYGIVDNSYAQALLKSDGDYLVSYSWIGETNTTAEFLMVQNSFMIAVPMVEPTITGSATKEYLSEYSEWDITVTGDCTITIS